MDVAEIASKIKSQPDQGSPVLVAIDGCGGAGKSTYAAKLANKLNRSPIVHIDDFYKPKKYRVDVTERTDVHVNFEFDRLKPEALEPLRRGVVAKYKTPKGEMVTIEPSEYVIVEGLGTLGSQLKTLFDYRVWIDSPEFVRRERGIERDSQDWTKIWNEEYLPQDARYVEEQEPQKEANWVIDNS